MIAARNSTHEEAASRKRSRSHAPDDLFYAASNAAQFLRTIVSLCSRRRRTDSEDESDQGANSPSVNAEPAAQPRRRCRSNVPLTALKRMRIQTANLFSRPSRLQESDEAAETSSESDRRDVNLPGTHKAISGSECETAKQLLTGHSDSLNTLCESPKISTVEKPQNLESAPEMDPKTRPASDVDALASEQSHALLPHIATRAEIADSNAYVFVKSEPPPPWLKKSPHIVGSAVKVPPVDLSYRTEDQLKVPHLTMECLDLNRKILSFQMPIFDATEDLNRARRQLREAYDHARSARQDADGLKECIAQAKFEYKFLHEDVKRNDAADIYKKHAQDLSSVFAEEVAMSNVLNVNHEEFDQLVSKLEHNQVIDRDRHEAVTEPDRPLTSFWAEHVSNCINDVPRRNLSGSYLDETIVNTPKPIQLKNASPGDQAASLTKMISDKKSQIESLASKLNTLHTATRTTFDLIDPVSSFETKFKYWSKWAIDTFYTIRKEIAWLKQAREMHHEEKRQERRDELNKVYVSALTHLYMRDTPVCEAGTTNSEITPCATTTSRYEVGPVSTKSIKVDTVNNKNTSPVTADTSPSRDPVSATETIVANNDITTATDALAHAPDTSTIATHTVTFSNIFDDMYDGVDMISDQELEETFSPIEKSPVATVLVYVAVVLVCMSLAVIRKS